MTRFPIDGTGRLASEREHPTTLLIGPAGGDLTGSYPNPSVSTSVQTVSSSVRTYYVQTVANGGNDSHTGLHWGQAFATPTAAVAACRSAGGGIVRIGNGTFVPPSLSGGTAGGYVVGSNTTIYMSAGTIVQPVVGSGDDQIGFRSSAWGWTGDDSPYIGNDNIHIRGGTIDLTNVSFTQSNLGIGLFGCRNSSVKGVKFIRGNFCLTFGSAGNGPPGDSFIPSQFCELAHCWFYPDPSNTEFSVAVTDCEGAHVHHNWIIGPAAAMANGGIDFEPNHITDRLNGGDIHDNYISGCQTAISVSPGSAMDPTRLMGVKVHGNTVVDGSISVHVPGAIAGGNSSYGSGAFAAGRQGIVVGRVSDTGPIVPNGCVVAGHSIRNLLGSGPQTALISIQDASHCAIGAISALDDGLTPGSTLPVVKEEILYSYIASGCTVTPGTGLHAVVAAGSIHLAGGGTQAVAGGTLTVAAADATRPRVDEIDVDTTDGSIHIQTGSYVLQQPAPAANVPPAAPGPGGNTRIAVAYVYVAPTVTSFTQPNIRDMRPLGADYNKVGPVVSLGNFSTPAVVLVGANSAEVGG